MGERSFLWNIKPENRHLPSVLEFASIRLLTKRRDWTEQERRLMKRAGRVHGLRTLGLVVLVSMTTWGGIEGYGTLRASALVESLQKVGTPEVPAIVKQLAGYRRWTDPQLVHTVQTTDDQSREHLHASLALLPVDTTQVEYLFKRLLSATQNELPVLRDALKTHQSTLAPKLWTVLESAEPDDPSLLPAASALASYAPDNARWEAVSSKVAQALVLVNAIQLGPWIEALHPVRSKLSAPLATIFQDKDRPESERKLATNILTDYASDDPDRLAELLMVADTKAYLSLFPVAEKRAEQVLPVLQAELARQVIYSWNDPPLDPTWTKPDAALVLRIESAQGILAERFAFCQTMPLKEFLTTAEALRKSGYRPVRSRPFVDSQTMRVAAVWARDGRNWRISSGMTAEEVRQEDDRNKKDQFLPVDVAGYLPTEKGGKPNDRYSALWVEKSGDDDARMYVGTTTDEQDDVRAKFKKAKLIPASNCHARWGGRSHEILRRLGTTHENRRQGSVVSRPVRGKLRAAPGQTERPVAPGRGGSRGKQTGIDPESVDGLNFRERSRISRPNLTMSMPCWLVPCAYFRPGRGSEGTRRTLQVVDRQEPGGRLRQGSTRVIALAPARLKKTRCPV